MARQAIYDSALVRCFKRYMTKNSNVSDITIRETPDGKIGIDVKYVEDGKFRRIGKDMTVTEFNKAALLLTQLLPTAFYKTVNDKVVCNAKT